MSCRAFHIAALLLVGTTLVFSPSAISAEAEQYEVPTVYVRPDKRLIKRILAGVDRNRQQNAPDSRPYYKCDVYSRTKLEPTRVGDTLTLPPMISETVAERFHTESPGLDRELIKANQISGIDSGNNLLSQFTGSTYMQADFYREYIDVLGVNFISPAQLEGLKYYDYYVPDTLSIDGRKTYRVRYHPRKMSSVPVFDGEMLIDAADFALRRVRAYLTPIANINWLRELSLETEYGCDSVWFYKRDSLYADFTMSVRKTGDLISVRGSRAIEYMNPDFTSRIIPDELLSPVSVSGDAGNKSDEFWKEYRPEELAEEDEGIYGEVEDFKGRPEYRKLYTVVNTLISGYLDVGPVGFGPVLKLASFNELEGFRPQIGIHTTRDLSRTDRWTAYLAYGTRDREFKGGLTWEHLFSREPTRKLTLDARYDVFQLGGGQSEFTSGNIVASIWHGNHKQSPMSSFSVLYEHEFSPSFNAAAEIRIKRHYSNIYVPMVDWKGNAVKSVASNEARLQLRFSKDETSFRGHYVKTYLHSRYPVVTVNLAGSVPGLRIGDVGFFRPELNVDYRLQMPPVGISDIHLEAGTIVGRVPYVYLNIPAGNITNLYDRTAFSCMDFLEFASDTWVSLFWSHNFNGILFGKIPYVRNLQIREVVTLKANWGALSNKNNGTSPAYDAVMRFPEGMGSVNVPYVEAGVGLANILSMFRVDFTWRLTHRETARRKFVVSLGMELRF